MKKTLIILGNLIFFCLVGFFLFKNRPSGHGPVKVMNPTYFESEGKIGRVLSRRFYTHFKEAKLIVLGSSPFLKNYQNIWHELIKTSLVDGIEIDDFISIEGLPPLTKKDRFFKELPEIDSDSGRVIIQVPSDEVWRKRVEQAYPNANFVFFLAPFSLHEQQQKSLGLDCQSEIDESFRCLAYKAGTRYYRKKLRENRLTAMMEQLGLNFYMIFVGEKF